MDVAKYIGLFLLKNNFVYIHGLGNLELRKKAAAYDGDALHPPSYEVMLTPSGSIDDNLANFIANNEQISISKASNALRDFSIQAREDLQEGKDVEIPSIGKFTEQKGKISFITAPAFKHTPPSIPTVKVATKKEAPLFSPGYTTSKPKHAAPTHERSQEDGSQASVNWIRVIAVALGFIVTAVVIYFLVQYMGDSNSTKEAPLIPEQMQEDAVPRVSSETVDISAGNTAPGNALASYTVQLGSVYTSLDKVTRRAKQLQSYGHNVEVKAADDSSSYFVVLPVSNYPTTDTTHLMDSLRVAFREISIYR